MLALPTKKATRLTLVKRANTPYWYLRGRVFGKAFFKSLHTADRAEAEHIRAEVIQNNAALFSSKKRLRMIPGIKGAQAREDGQIFFKGRQLAQHLKNNGYLQVKIQRKNYPVHRLVCAAFHGPAPDGRAMALHGDDDRLNNSPLNLRWGHHRHNRKDYKRNLLAQTAGQSVYIFDRAEFTVRVTPTEIVVKPKGKRP